MSETKRKPRYATSYIGVKDDIFRLYDMNGGKYYSNIVHAISNHVVKPRETIDEVILQKSRNELIVYIELGKHDRIHPRYVKAYITGVNKDYCCVYYQERINKDSFQVMYNTYDCYKRNRV